MGRRCTFITYGCGIRFSKPFIEKYKTKINFYNNDSLPISSKSEFKRFSDDLEEDIVNELKAQKSDWIFEAVLLYEDGAVTKLEFSKNGVKDYDLYLSEEHKQYNQGFRNYQ